MNQELRKWPLAYLLLLSGAVALQIALIDRLSLWNDELFSIFFALQSARDLLGEGWRLEESPPLYYLVLKGWIALFGTSEGAVRELSLLASVLTLPIIAALARTCRVCSGRHLAVLLFATDALQVELATMARPYALWVFFIALGLLGQTRLIAATVSASSCSVPRWLEGGLLFLVGTTAALYTHTTTVVFVAACNVVFVWSWLRQRPLRAHPVVAWLLLQSALLALTRPQLIVALGQFYSPGLAWMLELRPGQAINVLLSLFAGTSRPLQLSQIADVAASATLLGTMIPWLVWRQPAIPGLLVLTAAGFGLLSGISLIRPILLPRTALWLLVPVTLMMAAALKSLPSLRLRRFVTAAFLGASVVNMTACLFTSRSSEPWRESLQAVAADVRPSDIVVLMNGAPALALQYYLPAIGKQTYRWDATTAMGPGTSERWLDDRVMPLPSLSEADMEAELLHNRAVWLISRRAFFKSENQIRDMFTKHVAAIAAETVRIDYPNLLITRLEPR